MHEGDKEVFFRDFRHKARFAIFMAVVIVLSLLVGRCVDSRGIGNSRGKTSPVSRNENLIAFDDLNKEFEKLKLEEADNQFPGRQIHCRIFDSYVAFSNFRDLAIYAGATSNLARGVTEYAEDFFQMARSGIYKVIKSGEPLSCGAPNSDALMIQTIFGIMTADRPDYDPLIRKAYLGAKKAEIAWNNNRAKSNPKDETLRIYATGVVLYAENVWKFTPEELGIFGKTK